jgi:undecaprenyl-diphosphatase
LIGLLAAVPCFAGLDHKVAKDESGIWSRSDQNILRYGSLAVDLGMALYEGDGTRIGKTSWQSLDSWLVSGVIAEAGKRVFGRRRPAETDNPNEWFQGGKSFPSGEVTEISSIVTPYVLEYGHDHPTVYALELLPVYDAVARVKSQAHWQTDVLAGFVIGTATGYWAHERSVPLTVGVLPRGFTVGVRARF